MWNERYGEKEYAYGEEPNVFYKQEIDRIAQVGKALFVAEGEGRNAVYAAEKGWEVIAFDTSEQGGEKAQRLAASRQVKIDYRVGTFEETIEENERFDLIVFIYAHLPEKERGILFQKCLKQLNSEGKIILEAFSKGHLKYREINPSVGGPGVSDLLLSVDELKKAFRILSILKVEEHVIDLKEGKYHNGQGKVIRVVGKK